MPTKIIPRSMANTRATLARPSAPPPRMRPPMPNAQPGMASPGIGTPVMTSPGRNIDPSLGPGTYSTMPAPMPTRTGGGVNTSPGAIAPPPGAVPMPMTGMAKGGQAKAYAKGGSIDGCAQRGKTKGRVV